MSKAKFSVEIEIANLADFVPVWRGALERKDVRRIALRAVVDPEAMFLVLPQWVAKELDLDLNELKVKKCDAGGCSKLYDMADGVKLRLQGRENVFRAVIDPKRKDALIGSMVLTILDFLVDETNNCLVPRDPRYVITEIE